MDPTYQGRVPQVPYRQPNGRRGISRGALLVVLAIVVALIVGGILLSSSGDKTGPLQQRLAARLETLNKMAAEGDKNIVSGDLRELNSRLRIQILSDQKTIGDTIKQKKADKALLASEADAASFEALKDAQLNSRFDAAYRKLIAQKLDSTTLLIKEVYDKTRSKSLKDSLESSYTNLKQLEKQFAPAS